ncbi:MAG TPA: TIGR03790 family protein [Albitalea sp.]|nr:TIGR03790 family protein [Albitalea sp.]
MNWPSLAGRWLFGVSLAVLPLLGFSQAASTGAASSQLGRTAASAPRWLPVPVLAGRLTAKDIGLVINTADPYSVEVGAFYARARRLSPRQVLRIEMPVKPVLSPEEFQPVKDAIEARFGAKTQALALAWTLPYAVHCNSITAAVTLGFDAGLCAQTCAPSRLSPYFNARTFRPQTDLKLRPSMLLAAPDAAAAKRLIQRGVKSDRSLGLRGAPPVHAHFVVTADRARSVRAPLYPPPGAMRGTGIVVHVDKASAVANASRVLLYQTGATRVDKLDALAWVPGALADHLTSFGGQLDGRNGQMNVLEWIASGVTASYGTVSEPCSHQQKFPHPQVLLLNYAQGSTAIEAYWKSVAWPQQGVFVGEPLAAPFARR